MTRTVPAQRYREALDAQADEAFDDLTLLATQICGGQVGVIVIVDDDHRIRAAKVDAPAFFARVTAYNQTFEVPDASEDDRFAADPAVACGGMRFCAGTPLLLPDQRTIGALCVFDTSPRVLTPAQRRGLEALGRRAVSALVQSLARLDTEAVQSHLDEAQKLAHVGSWSWDMDTDTLTWSANMYRMLGTDPSANISVDHYMSHLSPDDRAETHRRLGEALAGGTSYSFEHPCYLPDGSVRILLNSVMVEFDQYRRPVVVHGTSQDMTEQRMREKRLDETRRLTQRVLEALPIGVFVKDIKDDFRYLNVNLLAAELVGSTPEDCVGKTDFDLFSADEAEIHRARDLETLAMGQLRVFNDLTVEHRKLGPVPMRVRYFVIPDAAGSPSMLIGMSEDMRAEKEAQRLIEDQRAKLVTSSKFSALGEMAGGLAHEINNPLAIIRGKATLLKRTLDKGPADPDRLRTELTKIENTSDRIAKIINGLRMFSRNSEKDPLLVTPLHEIVSETLELCRERITQNGTVFTVNLGEPVDVLCRSTQISQIVMNLLHNAHDAIQDRPEPWIRLDITQDRDFVLIKVTDCGSGIPADVVEKMMMPFFTTKSLGKGTGLGLSISKTLAEDNGGALNYNPDAPNTQFVLKVARAVAGDGRKAV